MIQTKARIIFFLLFAVSSISYAQDTRQWISHITGTLKNSNNSGTALVVDKSGNLIVTGWITNSGTGVDFLTIKYSPEGEELKKISYGGSGIDKPVALAVDSGKNIYVTGYTAGGAGGYDIVTIKYDSLLQMLWSVTYNGPGNGDDQPTSIAVNDSLNVFVSGWSKGSGTGIDFVTIKYDQTGLEKWSNRYNGPSNGSDSALGMVLYRNSDLFVTGTSVDSGYDYFTIKYNPSTGDSIWSARYNGFGLGNDIARGIVRNTNNEVYITGSSRNASGDNDYLTIGYTSSGAVKWISRYNSHLNTNDDAYAIGLSGTSRIYITGKSIQTGSFNDIVTVCYAQSDGDSNWVRGYDGTAKDNDIGIALLGGTNPYIIGSSMGIGVGKDFTLLRHTGTNGNLSMSARFNGVANSDDVPSALASTADAVYVTGQSKKLKGSEFLIIKYVSSEIIKYRSFSQESLAIKAISIKTTQKPTGGNVAEEAVKLAYPKIKKGYAGYPGGMVVGSANPDSAGSYGWMRFDKGKNVSAFVSDTGLHRWFNLYGGVPFIGEKKNPKKDKHNNHLAGELIALKISIAASDAGVTAPTFGDIRFDDGNSGNPYYNKTLRQIVELTDNYITYGGRYPDIDWHMIDSILTMINNSFADTLKIICRDPLVLTGVKPVDSIWFLKPAIAPLLEPLAFERDALALTPDYFELYQNYPNPFNPSTTISFSLPELCHVSLTIYDIIGREVMTLLDNQELDEGLMEINFDASSLSSGVYLYRLSISETNQQQFKKMLLLK
ncbi:MAG: T9SS type A sorting domain-containing protein [Ignavibacteriales bacterium]|nr:T9SS type A sorting domain-containing protein [Ignavibacteriales bacterium]